MQLLVEPACAPLRLRGSWIQGMLLKRTNQMVLAPCFQSESPQTVMGTVFLGDIEQVASHTTP